MLFKSDQFITEELINVLVEDCKNLTFVENFFQSLRI